LEKLDVVYLAPDIASLFGAVGLAAGGLKVIVLVEGHRTRVLESEDGTEVSPPVEPFLWRGLRPVVFLEPLLNRLKLLINARGKVKHLNPALQVVTPDTRLDYFGADERLMKEMVREFGPDEADRAVRLLNELNEMAEQAYELASLESFPPMPMGLGERLMRRESSCRKELDMLLHTSFEEILHRSNVSEAVRTLLYCAIAGLGMPTGMELPACAAAILLDGIRRGIYRVDEPALRGMLMNTFKRNGGYTMPLGELEGIEIGKDKISALRISKSNYIVSRLYVAGSKHVINFIPEYESTAACARLHILTVLARKGAVPVGMKDRVVTVSRKAEPLYPEHIARISVAKVNQVKEDKNVFLTVESYRPPGIDTIETELWDALRGVAPFMDDFVVSHRYDVDDSAFSAETPKAFFELLDDKRLTNLLPTESELLAQMGMGEGVINGRILSRVILKKLGLRAQM